ncbi:MAG: PepSY domain-containing protein, partial [Burkholderiales bacterium]
DAGGSSLAAQRGRISAGEAAQIVQRRTGARVLDAQPVRGGYRIKVLTRQGDVRMYFVDGETGSMQ